MMQPTTFSLYLAPTPLNNKMTTRIAAVTRGQLVTVFRFRMRSELRTRKLVLDGTRPLWTWRDIKQHFEDTQYFGHSNGVYIDTIVCRLGENGRLFEDSDVWFNNVKYVLSRVPIFVGKRRNHDRHEPIRASVPPPPMMCPRSLAHVQLDAPAAPKEVSEMRPFKRRYGFHVPSSPTPDATRYLTHLARCAQAACS